MIEKVRHIGTAVHDLVKALSLHRDTLGLHVDAQDTAHDQCVRAAFLAIGESEIELLELKPDSIRIHEE